MFTKVHHVTYVVHSVQEMADYLEKNFSLKAEMVTEEQDRGYKCLVYRIGPTIMDFLEPTKDDTPVARQLKESGPGVAHVAWGVEGIDQVLGALMSKGNEIMGDAVRQSPLGYRTINIETSSSHGIRFQLAEG